jgi:hypothetical protein
MFRKSWRFQSDDINRFQECFGATATMKEDGDISSAPFSCALYDEANDKLVAVHIPPGSASGAVFNYAIKNNGIVIDPSHMASIFFTEMSKANFGRDGKEDDMFYNFLNDKPDDREVLSKIVCCFYQQADHGVTDQSREATVLPVVHVMPVKLISFGAFSGDDCVGIGRECFADLKCDLRVLDLVNEDKVSFNESLNVVFATSDCCHSFHFREHTISVAVATVLLALHGGNSQGMELFYDKRWSGPSIEDTMDANVKNPVIVVTQFLTFQMEIFLVEIAVKYPHLKMENVSVAQRNAQHNVICCNDF